MQSGKSFKNYKGSTDFDVIVIGSGIGGLTAASFLAASGKKVLILERHYVAGGFTHVFSRREYEWDVGVHYLGDVGYPPAETARLFRYLSRGKLKWAPMDKEYDRIIFPDRSYGLIAGRAEYRAQLHEWFPEEKSAIDAYMELLPRVTGTASKLFFAEKAAPKFISKPFGKWMRKGFLKYAGKTTGEILDGLTQNKQLKAVLLGQWGDYGLPPSQSSFAIQAMVANHYMYGGCYPIGGSAEFADTIIPPIEELGGQVLVRAEVDEVIVENGRAKGVKMKDGRTFNAPIVISNAGFSNTMDKLLPKSAQRTDHSLDKLGLEPSGGHICLYLGFKKTPEELELPKTNLWIYPGYDHDKQVEAYSKDANAAFPVVYISFPAAKDPDFQNRFPGKSTIEIITMMPWEWVEKWEKGKWMKRGEDYDAWKENLSQRLLKELYKHVPLTEGQVDHYELSTPLSTKHFANYPKGELYGLSHTPKRFEQRKLGVRTDIKGFFMTGQDSVSCGVAGGMFGGVLTASAILTKNVMGTAFKWSKEND